MGRIVALLLCACSGVTTHASLFPVSHAWGEPSGKASFPLIVAFDGNPLVHPLGGLGYGVVVLQPMPPADALRVIEHLRNTALRWDGQLVIVGVERGVAAAIKLAEVRSAQGVAALMDAHDPNEPPNTTVYYHRFDNLNALAAWLCQTAHARGCPPRPPPDRYKMEDDKPVDEDMRLRSK